MEYLLRWGQAPRRNSVWCLVTRLYSGNAPAQGLRPGVLLMWPGVSMKVRRARPVALVQSSSLGYSSLDGLPRTVCVSLRLDEPG